MHSQMFTAWILATGLLLCCSLVSGQEVCGNGVIEGGEQCDDNNTVTGDGCSNVTCLVEDHFECRHNATSPSVCAAILLDLNVDDNTTLNYTLEFFETNAAVFLVNISMLEIFVPSGSWDYLDVVILKGDTAIEASVEVDFDFVEALNTGRISSPSFASTRQIFPEMDYTDGVLGRNVTSGERIETVGNTAEIYTALLSAIYEAHEEPGYQPQDVCLIAVDSLYTTTACITLYYIGSNSNPPTITYNLEGVAHFTEGQSDPVRIVEGSIVVEDDDHPTRFLIQSASARITGFVEGQEEWLSLNMSYVLPTGLYSTFNNVTGTLTITGNANTTVYSAVLNQITYFNNMNNPEGFSRRIEVTVEDGDSTSMPININIMIINTNDNPLISLNGESPVTMMHTNTYTEATGAVAIVPNLYVVDTDPSPVIIGATVVLTNPVDGGEERLSISDIMELNLTNTSSWHRLELIGAATPAVYTAVLRTLTYEHSSANPSTEPRVLEFTVEDNFTATSMVSTLTLNIKAVNDPPVLSYESGGSVEMYSYIEDDPAINIGQNIILEDVDSPITSVSLYLTNLLDGSQDNVSYNSTLLETLSISVSVSSNGTSRMIVFEGETTASNYTEILRSIMYTNLHMNNLVTDGQRTITISANDTSGTISNTLTLLINVTERNDGPAIDLGNGNNAGFEVTYTENGPSVPLGISHLIRVMDEEGHNISSMDIQLLSTNGELDEGDILFLHTPVALPFLSDPNTVITDRMISINFTGDGTDYTNALQAVRYINTEVEPTLFVNGYRLIREVVIRITDASTLPAATTNEVRVTVQIEPINDNAPRIIINSDPVCTEDYRDREGEVVTIRRRSAAPLMRNTHRRRRRSNTYSGKTNILAAPKVHEIKPHFIHSEKGSCLSEVVVAFNTDCNAPVVEVQKELDSLLTFVPSSLAKTPHYGYWMDYQTLVVVFRECVKMTDEHSKKPLYVVFYDQGDSCDWDSPCNIGVCYYNNSGCPVTGYHRFHTSTRDCYTLNATSYTDFRDTSKGLVIMVMSAVLVAMVTILLCEWKLGRRRFVGHHVSNENNSSLEFEPIVTNHIIDITVPAVATGTAKSLPPLSDTKVGAGESQEELLPKKDECCPPSYSQIEETNLASNTNGLMAISLTSTSKAPRIKHISPQGYYSSLASEKGVTTVVTPEGEGQKMQEIHYVVREARVEGEEEQGGDREGGEKHVLRGVGEHSPAVDGIESVQASVHTGIRSGEDYWKTRDRGGVAGVKCHPDKDTTQLREHSQHSHSYWQYDDNTQHPH